MVTETTWHHTQQTQFHYDGSVTMKFQVDQLEEMLWWLLGWCGRVKIISPTKLRSIYVTHLKKAVEMNGR
jgi:predicted DNA-binding transcriptional regulator YafY